MHICIYVHTIICNSNNKENVIVTSYFLCAAMLYGYLTFILECSVTTKTFKVASNHRGSTKLEFVKTANCSSSFFLLLFQTGYLNTAVSTPVLTIVSARIDSIS